MAATPLQKQIKAEIRRIRKAAARLEKRGYNIERLPSYNPRQVSKRTLERLKKVKTKQLIERPGTTYHGAATYGEQVTGKAGRAAERTASAKKAARSRKIAKARIRPEYAAPGVNAIEDLINIINTIPDTTDYYYGGQWVQSVDLSGDKNLLISYLENARENAGEATYTYYASIKGEIDKLVEEAGVKYGEAVEYAMAQIATLIKGAPLDPSEKAYFSAFGDALNYDLENWEE